MNATAYVNHGRWIIDCPDEDCQAGLKCSDWTIPETLLTGLVCDCMDEVVCDHPTIPHGLAIDITYPDERDEITAILNLRSKRANRNWYPGETVEELKAENVTHGVRI